MFTVRTLPHFTSQIRFVQVSITLVSSSIHKFWSFICMYFCILSFVWVNKKYVRVRERESGAHIKVVSVLTSGLDASVGSCQITGLSPASPWPHHGRREYGPILDGLHVYLAIWFWNSYGKDGQILQIWIKKTWHKMHQLDWQSSSLMFCFLLFANLKLFRFQCFDTISVTPTELTIIWIY